MLPIFYMFEKELIEHKIVTRLPLFLVSIGLFIIAAILFNANGIENLSFEFNIQGDMTDVTTNFNHAINAAISVATGAVSILLSTIYLAKAFTKERQEGSLMFWRSMPISDLLHHIIKLGFALLIIPFICSLMVLIAALFLWIISLFSSHTATLFMGPMSLQLVLFHWFAFLAKMLLISVSMLPFACLTLAVSQRVNSPLLMVVIGVFCIKIISSVVFGFDQIASFIAQMSALPVDILSSAQPLKELQQISLNSALCALLLTIIFFAISLSFSKQPR